MITPRGPVRNLLLAPDAICDDVVGIALLSHKIIVLARYILEPFGKGFDNVGGFCTVPPQSRAGQ